MLVLNIRRFATTLLLAGLALLAVGCTRPPPTPTTADLGRVSSRYPGLTLAELQQGRDVYQSRCGSCHVLYQPSQHGPSEWPHLIGEMAQRAKLTEADRNRVERYLVALSSRSRPIQAQLGGRPR